MTHGSVPFLTVAPTARKNITPMNSVVEENALPVQRILSHGGSSVELRVHSSENQRDASEPDRAKPGCIPSCPYHLKQECAAIPDHCSQIPAG